MPAPTGGGCPTAQSSGQLKVRFFVVLYNNFVISLHHHIMSSMYQVTKNCISDAIDILHHGNYSNLIAAIQAFRINEKRYNKDFKEKFQKICNYLLTKL